MVLVVQIEFVVFGTSNMPYISLEEVVKADMFDFRSIHLFAVFFSEEEPVGEGHVEELRVFPVKSDKIQSFTVAVSATEERSRLPLFPGISSRLLHCQGRQGNPDRQTDRGQSTLRY